MVKEIYIRDASDPYYDPNMIDYSNEVEDAISQIKMILGTSPGQVFGDFNFGADLEYMVYGTKKDAQEVTEKIKEQIHKYVKLTDSMSVNCSVNFGKDERDVEFAVVDIYINGTKSIGFLVDKDM